MMMTRKLSSNWWQQTNISTFYSYAPVISHDHFVHFWSVQQFNFLQKMPWKSQSSFLWAKWGIQLVLRRKIYDGKAWGSIKHWMTIEYWLQLSKYTGNKKLNTCTKQIYKNKISHYNILAHSVTHISSLVVERPCLPKYFGYLVSRTGQHHKARKAPHSIQNSTIQLHRFVTKCNNAARKNEKHRTC